LKKLLGKILMMVAVATIIGHNTLPHHHHMGIQYLMHQDENHVHKKSTDIDHHDHEKNSEGDHNIFSFAQLDDCFLPSQFSKVSIDLPILFLLTPIIRFQLDWLVESSKIHFGYYKEFPPPIDYLSHLFSRPPPTC
jgi:hypothetical protein